MLSPSENRFNIKKQKQKTKPANTLKKMMADNLTNTKNGSLFLFFKIVIEMFRQSPNLDNYFAV